MLEKNARTAMTAAPPRLEATARFRVSPLIRYTLYGLFISLLLPLPFVQAKLAAPVPLWLTWAGLATGWVALVAALSQRVETDVRGVRVGYAPWVPRFLIRHWQLAWSEVSAINSAPTSQGGRVHYLVDRQGNRFLLPMRIAGFARFLRILEAETGLDTSRVKPLAQPWMYLALLVCVVILFACDLLILAAFA